MDDGSYTSAQGKVPAQCQACGGHSTILTIVLQLLLLFCRPRERSPVERDCREKFTPTSKRSGKSESNRPVGVLQLWSENSERIPPKVAGRR